MGNQQSTTSTITNVVNDSLTNVLMDSSQTCGQNNTAIQNMNFSNIHPGAGCNLDFSGISQTSIQTPNFTCSTNSNNDSQLAAQFATQLQQQSSAAISGIPGAINNQAVSNAVTNVQNTIKNNIHVSQVASCVQNNLAQQTQNFTNITPQCPAYCNNGCPAGNICDMSKCTTNFNNINQTLTQNAVTSCLSANSAVNKAISSAASDIATATTASNTGFLNIDTIFSSLSGSYLYVIIACVICCLAIVISSGVFALSPAGQSSTTQLSAQLGQALAKAANK